MTEIIIDVQQLTKKFGNLVAVDHVDLKVKKGEVFGFLGPNGSGKTTTLRMLSGLLTPDSGQGTCLGYDILHESRDIKKRVGYMTQKFSLYSDLSVIENLNFMANIYGITNKKNKINDLMVDFELDHHSKQLAGNLSGGWKQRLTLAACMLHKPDLLILDEPTAGIDPIARREFWDRIHALSEQGVTTLLTTHYMDEAERCTRLAYIANSKLIITGGVDDVIQSTGLKTWEIRGNITPKLLLKIKQIDVVTQAALFGRYIHASGSDEKQIIQALNQLQQDFGYDFKRVESSLEDAFLRLVKQHQESEI